MAQLGRKLLRIFGGEAGTSQIGQFGSLKAGLPTTSKDPDIIQQLSAWDNGWLAALIANNSPALEDDNAVKFVLSYMLKYLFQVGVPEWMATEQYYENGIVAYNGTLYRSINGVSNLNEQPDTSPTFWVPLLGYKAPVSIAASAVLTPAQFQGVVFVDGTSAVVAATLPSASDVAGITCTLICKSAINSCSLIGTINGVSGYDFSGDNDVVRIYSDGTSFYFV